MRVSHRYSKTVKSEQSDKVVQVSRLKWFMNYHHWVLNEALNPRLMDSSPKNEHFVFLLLRQVVPNLYEFIYFVKKENVLKNVGNHTVNVSHWLWLKVNDYL